MNWNKVGAYSLFAACAFLLAVPNAGAQQTPVLLGTASSYGVLAGSTVTNTGPTVVSGDLGLSPGTAVTGFPPGTVGGTKQIANAAAAQAQTDLTTAYNDAAGRAPATVATELGGQTLVAGAYKSASGTFAITGILTLDAQNDANSVWVFQTASTLTTASASQVKLINGASYCNVFWQVGSSATLGTNSDFQGTILASSSITLTTGATVNGAVLARNGAVTLDTNAVTTNCSLAPTPGSIKVVKNTVGGDGTFAFTSNFGLTSLTTSGGTASQTIGSLTPGSTYSVIETVPSGWVQNSATCTSGTPTAITVVSGATTTCTFTNTMALPPPTGSITVVKNTVGGNGTFAFTSSFGLASLTTVAGTASQTFSGLTPGSGFNVNETLPLPTGWTLTGSSCTNGTPAAITVVAGATTTCTFTNTYAAPTGSIKVVKNTVGGNGTFAFTSNFGLASLTTVAGTASQTFSGLTPGSGFNVSETLPLPTGWTLTGSSCTNGTPAAITVAAGATTTCTFTNTYAAPTGSIKVVKHTVGGNGTFGFTSNFGLVSLTTVGGTASQTFSGLTVGGSFSVSEAVPLPSGWTLTGSSCTNGTPTAITVVAGATTTCTFTNTKAATPTGSIQIVKKTVGGDGTFTFTSNFGLGSMTTIGGTASQTFSGLTPGSSFSVSETVPSGWTQTSASCTNGTPAAFSVVADGTTICTFVNTKAAVPSGAIQVVKNSVGGNGTFAFTSNFGLGSLTTIGGTASQTFSGLRAGVNYSVSETVPAGWTQTSATCTSGTPASVTVMADTTTICTFVNNKAAALTGSIKVVKNTVGGNGTFAFTSNFGLNSLTTTGGTASQTFSGLTLGNSYSVSETVPSGWTQNSATCTNGTPTAITVVADGTTTCTFTNTMEIVAVPDLIIRKSHIGDFRQGDAADTYTLTVTNVGLGPTTDAVTVTDTLPPGLTATAISGTGWNCTLATLNCTRSDSLAAGASYPVITVTVSVSKDPLAFTPAASSPAFQPGDILISMADGTVQWRNRDWTLVKMLAADAGQAKGLAFDSSGRLFVTHWYGPVPSGNDVVTFDRNGNRLGLFGDGFNCNPSSIVFDNSGNAYIGQADCSNQIFKFDSSGNLLAKYDVAVENRGTYHIILDPNQCTMYYTSEGANVKRFNVCTDTQMSNFNTAPLPDPATGAQQFALLPGGGMLVSDFSVIASLDASGNFVRTYGAPGSNCWLGIALDLDGASFWASDWCASTATRFDIATGKVLESHVVADTGFSVKQIEIPGNIFFNTVVNKAVVAGGGESITNNDSADDSTIIAPPLQSTGQGGHAEGVFNAAGYAPTVAAGSIASVFGSNLSQGQAVASTMPLPTTLASSSFQIGGVIAPLFFASPSQVDLQIPWELAGQPQAMVIGKVGAVNSMQQLVSIAPFAPGIFMLNEPDSTQGAILIAGTHLLAAPSGSGKRPVAAGESITIYCTGLGAVSNQPATGTAAQASPLSVTTTTPTVSIGGIMAQVSLSALVPGAVGLYQVIAQVPAGVPAGDAVPVILRIGGVSSNAVTIAVE